MAGIVMIGADRPAQYELSVVICTLGRADVESTVASVAAAARQAERTVETILVWQGDEPPPELPVRTVDVFPSGVAYARNRAALAAAAPLLAFVDDDEVVDPGFVAAVLDAFTDPAIDAVFGPIAPRDDRGLPYCNYTGDGVPRSFQGRRTHPWVVGSGGNMSFRRDVLLETRGFDPLFGTGAANRSAHDIEMIYRLLRSGRRLAWAPDAVVYHPTKTPAERLASRFPYGYGMAKIGRRHADAYFVARYVKSISDTVIRSARARDARRLREVRETARGFGAGLVRRGDARPSRSALERAPGEIVRAIGGETVQPFATTYRPDPHLLYRIGGDRVLHAYVNPTPQLRHALAVRDRVRSASDGAGIPAQFVSAEGRDALWVLEEWLPGAAPRRLETTRAFPAAAEWALASSVPSGATVERGSWWAAKAEPAATHAPAELRSRVVAALQAVGRLPGTSAHGDYQWKNILLCADGRVNVVDWEHAHDDGPPGLDVTFLAATSRGTNHLRGLARDGDAHPLARLLRRAGVTVALGPYLLALLAVWSAEERARLTTLGLPRATPAFAPLLGELAPLLG